MIVHFLTRPQAPILANIRRLVQECEANGHQTEIYYSHRELQAGELLFILAYDRILPAQDLAHHKHNIVIHASDLPDGKGFSPMSWQIAEGQSDIVFTMFEAVAEVDAGAVYAKQSLRLDGHELYDQWKSLQADMQENMVRDFLQQYPQINGEPQSGTGSYYRKRNRSDDRIDPQAAFLDAFNTIRVCDPVAFPAWFQLNGRRFKVTVEPLDESDDA